MERQGEGIGDGGMMMMIMMMIMMLILFSVLIEFELPIAGLESVRFCLTPTFLDALISLELVISVADFFS